MSRITSKNLFYDNKPPPFLAHLKNTHALSEGPQGINSIRPKKIRCPDQLAEDEPVYFDKGTRHTWTKKEWETKIAEDEATKFEESDSIGHEAPPIPKVTVSERKNIAINGGRKKRKSGKIIGAGVDKDQSEDLCSSVVSTVATGNIYGTKSSSSNTGRKKGKGSNTKKIKLSFDD